MADVTVSGPAQYSKRQDLQGYNGRQAAQYVPGMPYGEGQATYNMGTSAPIAASETPPAGAGPMGATRPMPVNNLNTPNPDQNAEITHGASFGPGAGPEVLPTAPSAPDDTAATLRALAGMFPDPDLTRLVQRLTSEGR
jgi:hypothetical protein